MTVNRFIISIFIILLSLVYVEAARERFLSIVNVRNNGTLEIGQYVNIDIKFTRQPLETDKTFDIVIMDVNNNKTSGIVSTVQSDKIPFIKDNQYTIQGIVPIDLPEGNYKMYGYIGEEKISESSYNVTLIKSTKEPVKIEPTETNVTTPTQVPGNNNQNASNADQTANKTENNHPGLIGNGIIVIGVVAAAVVIIFAILYICCIRDSKDKRHDSSVYELPHAVSEPQLISSSSPINAIPLRYGNSPFANNVNASFMMSPRTLASPMASPIAHSGSNYSSGFNTETQALTSKQVKGTSFQSPDSLPRDPRDIQIRDPFYGNNVSQDSINSRDDEMPSPTPSYYYQLFKPHQVYRVLYDFKPSLPDEIEVQAGDVIRTEETFEDGWAFGVNMTSGKKGTFPMNCLEDDFTENENKSCISERSQRSQRSRRTSSLPNNQNIHALQMMLDNISDDNIKADDSNDNSQNFQKAYYISQANNTKV